MAITDYYNSIQTPDTADMELQLQQLVQQGELTPEQAQAALAGPSAMQGITLDPALKQKQMASLAALQQLADQGGMTTTDQANLTKTLGDINTQARGSREAILNNAQARGLGSSGLGIMAQLQNQQDAASRASQAGLDTTASARDRALQALIQGGSIAGQQQAQDFNQQAQIAGAQDAISKFNAQNQQATNFANTAANNNAQQMNLQAKQTVANTNAEINNQQQQYNKQLQQQNFDNQMKKAAGESGISTSQNQLNQQQNIADQQERDKLIGTGLSAVAMFSDERGKENIEKFDPSDFLDSLTGYKFQYKDKAHGEGPQVGVMAQDLMKTDAGSKLVVDTPEGYMVDYGKSGPATLASIANLNERLKQLEKERKNG